MAIYQKAIKMKTLISITIGTTTIHQSDNGLYLITDLWKAGGKRSAKLPDKWLILNSTVELINELQRQNLVVLSNQLVIEVNNGSPDFGGGTYLSEDLVLDIPKQTEWVQCINKRRFTRNVLRGRW